MRSDTSRTFNAFCILTDFFAFTFSKDHLVHSKHYIDRSPDLMTHISKKSSSLPCSLTVLRSLLLLRSLVVCCYIRNADISVLPPNARCTKSYQQIHHNFFFRGKPYNHLRILIGDHDRCYIYDHFHKCCKKHYLSFQHKDCK